MRHFKVYYQHDAMQCGQTCLQMVCHYHGVDVSSEVLSKLCFPTNQGVSLLGMSEAAGKLGLHTVCGKIDIGKLADVPMPCILHWKQNHFVVLYNTSRRGRMFHIADPGKGLISYTKDDFLRHWASTVVEGKAAGVVMLIEPTPAFYEHNGDNEKQAESHSFSYLFGYVRKYRRYFGQVFFGLLLGCVLQLILPFLTQAIVDVGIKRRDIGFIWLVLAGQLVLTVSRTSLNFIRSWLLLHISMRINVSLVSDFFIKLLRLPMSFFDTKQMGDILQRMSDHSRVNSFLTGQTLGIMLSMLSFIVFGIVLLAYNALIFFIFILGCVLYSVWLVLFLRRRKVLDYELFEQQAINNNKTYEFITSMQEIKLQRCEQRRRWEWEDTQADLFGIQLKSLKLKQTQDAGGILINELKNIVITVVSAAAVINGELTLGMMLAVQYIIGQLSGPVDHLMSFFYALQDVKLSLERINEIHTVNDENGVEHNIRLANEPHKIRIDDISFKYDLHGLEKTIDGISVNLPKGKVTAIVGASGSGKTTLVKLMLGYYPVSEGRIIIDETDIESIDLDWWRSQCGVVMQDGVIFSESIARNIAVDDEDINIDRLMRAAEIACIKSFIIGLPLGFNTKIGREGLGLSQGQKQRILIARAVYKDPNVIFLDEATNSLDAKKERMITDNLADFFRGRTVVIVAHRLSTVKNADQIIVVDNGHVVETGLHVSLIANKGVYYQLVKNQLEI